MSYCGCYLVLNCLHIAQVTIEALGPKMFLGRRVNQSYCDTDSVADALDRTLDNRVNVQFTRDLFQWLLRFFELHHRSARGHSQGSDFCQTGDEHLRHAIREVILS